MDLSSLYSNGAGASASLMAGQQFADQRAASAEALRAQQLANQGTAAMNPLNALFRQGQVNQQSAELPGIVGDSQSRAAAGQEAMQVLPQKVAAKFSQLATQIGADGMQQMGQDGEKLSTLSAAIKQLPPALQKDAFVKGYQAYGGNVQSPTVQALMQTPDAQFQSALEVTGKGMALAGSKYMQQSALQKQGEDMHERVAKGNNETSIEVAKLNAQARVDAAEKRATAMGQKVDVLQQLLKVPMAQRDAEWNAQYTSAMESLTTLKAATGGDLAAAMMGGGRPVTTDQRTTSTIDKVTNMNGGAKPNPQSDSPDIHGAVTKAGWDYEPDKYIYRINPQTGLAQRKPK